MGGGLYGANNFFVYGADVESIFYFICRACRAYGHMADGTVQICDGYFTVIFVYMYRGRMT